MLQYNGIRKIIIQCTILMRMEDAALEITSILHENAIQSTTEMAKWAVQ